MLRALSDVASSLVLGLAVGLLVVFALSGQRLTAGCGEVSGWRFCIVAFVPPEPPPAAPAKARTK